MPLFTFFGIRVRAHASLVVLIALTILLNAGLRLRNRIAPVSMAALFTSRRPSRIWSLLYGSRWLGGRGDDVLLWPLGGLASADPPHSPLPVFLTVAAGPGHESSYMLRLRGWSSTSSPPGLGPKLNTLHASPSAVERGIRRHPLSTVDLLHQLRHVLFNLLPIFPLDGGQIVQSILWPIVGYVRSMIIATTTGMVGCRRPWTLRDLQSNSASSSCSPPACSAPAINSARPSAKSPPTNGPTAALFPSFYVPPETPAPPQSIAAPSSAPQNRPPGSRRTTENRRHSRQSLRPRHA